ncbi:MAG: hypothetical protein WBV94_21590 [Blastocatellia bacterium]
MAKEKVETVRMTRSNPAHPGGPVEADVHPDEITNYAAGGWSVAEPEQTNAPKQPSVPKQSNAAKQKGSQKEKDAVNQANAPDGSKEPEQPKEQA